MEASQQKRQPSLYEGLSGRAKIWIIGISILIASCSIGFAWQSWTLGKNLQFTSDDVKNVTAIHVDTKQEAPAVRTGLFVYTLQVSAHLKHIGMRQSVSFLAVGTAFALLAIGFALFLIGADGAFHVQAQRGGDAKFQFASTAPGLLCFCLATALIAMAVGNKNTLELPTFELMPTIGTPPANAVDKGKAPAQKPPVKRGPPKGLKESTWKILQGS
jgi:hypothetical protein